MTLDGGLLLAKDTSTQEVGLAFESNVPLYRVALFSMSFFVTIIQNGFVEEDLKEGEMFFMGFASLADRDPKMLRLVSTSSLVFFTPLSSPNAMEVLKRSPVAGFVKGEPGLVFANRIQAMMEFSHHPTYFEHVDQKSFAFSEVNDAARECLFLSMKMLLTQRTCEPFAVVPRESVAFFVDPQGAVPFRSLSLSPSLALAAAARPTAVVAEKEKEKPLQTLRSLPPRPPQCAKTAAQTNTQALTLATPVVVSTKRKALDDSAQVATTAERFDDDSPNDDDEDDAEERTFSPSPLVVAVPAKRAKKNPRKFVTLAQRAFSDESESERESDALPPREVSLPQGLVFSVPSLAERESESCVAGYELPGADRRKSSSEFQGQFEAGKALFKESWTGLKGAIHWKHIWVRRQNGLTTIDASIVPLTEGHDTQLIENLQYFTYDALYMHMFHNPAITEEFVPLWGRMRVQGWNKVPLARMPRFSSSDSNEDAFMYVYEGPTGRRNKVRQAGVHVFSNMIAVVRYVARFPYPLQDDVTLAATLRKHGWACATHREKNYFKAPGQEKIMNIADVRAALWTQPELLFSAYFGIFGEQRLRNALILPEEEALAEELEPVSPQIDGLSLADKEQCMTRIVKLSQKLIICHSRRDRVPLEDRLAAELQALRWRRESAEKWAKTKWWRYEYVWVPPHAVLNGHHERHVCVDYFFDLCDAARLFVAFRESILMRIGFRQVEQFLGKNFTNLDDPRFSLQKRIEFIVTNSDAPFEDFQLEKMLCLAGWTALRTGALFVPPQCSERDAIARDDVPDYISARIQKTVSLSISPSLSVYLSPKVEAKKSKGEKKEKKEKKEKPLKSERENENDADAEREGEGESDASASPVKTEKNKDKDKKKSKKNKNKSDPSPCTPHTDCETTHTHTLDASSVYTPGTNYHDIYSQILSGQSWGRVYLMLKSELGWSTGGWRGNAYILAPWTREDIEQRNAFERTTSRYFVDLSPYKENQDFFAESDEGKARMMRFLRDYGLDGEGIKHRAISLPDSVAERETDKQKKKKSSEKETEKEKTKSVKENKSNKAKQTDRASASASADKVVIDLDDVIEIDIESERDSDEEDEREKAKKSTKTANKSTKSKTAKPVKRVLDGPEATLAEELSAERVYFSGVFSSLLLLGWSSAWRGEEPLVVPPWTICRLTLAGVPLKKNHFPTENDFPEFCEDCDFFSQSDEGKAALFAYLRKYGALERKEPFPPLCEAVREEQGIALKTRSPRRALRHAVEPSEHALYLADYIAAHSESERERESEEEEEEEEERENDAERERETERERERDENALCAEREREEEPESAEQTLQKEIAEIAPLPCNSLLAERAREREMERQREREQETRRERERETERARERDRAAPSEEEERAMRDGAAKDEFSLSAAGVQSGVLFALLWKQLRERLHWTSRASPSGQTLYFKSERDAEELCTDAAVSRALCDRVFVSREQVERYVAIKSEIERASAAEQRALAQRNAERAVERERDSQRKRAREEEEKESEKESEKSESSSSDESDSDREREKAALPVERVLFSSPSSSQEEQQSEHEEEKDKPQQQQIGFSRKSCSNSNDGNCGTSSGTSSGISSGKNTITSSAMSGNSGLGGKSSSGATSGVAKRQRVQEIISIDSSPETMTGRETQRERERERPHTPPAQDESERERDAPLTPLTAFVNSSLSLSQQSSSDSERERETKRERESLFLNNGRSLGEYLSLSHSLLHPKTGGEHEVFPVPARETESLAALRVVHGALRGARSAWVYLSGGVGGGKTLLVRSLVAHLQRLARPLPASLARALNGRADCAAPFKVAMVNGAGIVDARHLLEDLHEQLGLSLSLSVSHQRERERDPQQRVRERLGARALGVSFRRCAALDALSPAGAGNGAAAASPATGTSSPLRGPVTTRVPPTLLIVNEIDMLKRDALQELRALCEREHSSLVVLCTGNTVDLFAQHNQGSHYGALLGGGATDGAVGGESGAPGAPVTIVMTPYDAEALVQIVAPRAGRAFDQKALEILAKKATGANYKCDVRAMLQLTQIVLENAREKLDENALAGPVVPVVTMRMVHDLLSSQEAQYKAQPLAALTPVMTNVLVSLLAARVDQRTFSAHDAVQAYQCYRSAVQVAELPPGEIHKTLEFLCDVGLVVKSQKSSKTSIRSVGVSSQYHLQIDIPLMLTKDDLAESHKNALQRALNLLPAPTTAK